MEWLAVIIGTFAALAVAFIKGQSAGEDKAENKAGKEALENVAEAKKVADDIAAMSADAKRDKLRADAKE